MQYKHLCTDVCEKFWQWRVLNFPEFATSVGEHKYDDKLNDMSLEGFNRRYMESKSILNDVEECLEYIKSNSRSCVNLELLRSDLNTYVSGFAYKSYLQPINRSEGQHLHFIDLLDHMKKETKTDYEVILERLASLPRQIEQVIELMMEGIRQSITLHEYSIAPVPNQLREAAQRSFWTSPFSTYFQNQPSSVKDTDWKVLVDAAESIVTIRIFPMYLKLADFISDRYMKHTRKEIGVNNVYDGYLKYHTSTDFNAKTIHELGLKEVKRIEQRMVAVKNEMDFKGSLLTFMKSLQNNEQMRFSNEKELLTNYVDLFKPIEKELPKLFKTLPKDNCLILPVPKEIENTSCAGLYKSGYGNRKGVFYVNLSCLEKRHRYQCMALALHEGIPGHHLQSETFINKKPSAKFRSYVEGGGYSIIPARFPLHTAFMEGWALYAEYLGEELNLLDNPCDLFGKLRSEMLRAARLVVDTGIHAFKWSRQEAIDYIVDVVGLPLVFATAEVDRYITWPGQACAYKIGELKIHELRRIAERRLGDHFNLKEFHNVLLSFGSAPIDFIELKMHSYIDSKVDEIT